MSIFGSIMSKVLGQDASFPGHSGSSCAFCAIQWQDTGNLDSWNAVRRSFSCCTIDTAWTTGGCRRGARWIKK